MGREVTLVAPKLDDDQFFDERTGRASVCIEGPPERQCYTAPEKFGRFLTVDVVELQRNLPALLFSASTNGVSGFEIHFALLRPQPGSELQDLFAPNVEISSQNQHAFIKYPIFSAAKIFVTADYVWGRDESHFSPHRFLVSVYALRPSLEGDNHYYLEDQYMTSRKYALDATLPEDILAAEKPEILVRLRRVKAEEVRQNRAPH